MNQTIQLLYRHRSVRRYTDQHISDALVEELIEAGQTAASSSFLQAYSVIQVTDSEKRAKLAVWCGNQRHVEEAPVFLVFCGDLHKLDLACQQQETEMKKGMTELFIVATVDTAIFGQTVLIAAESMGIGGVYVGGIRNHPHEVSELLQLPAQVYPIFGMSLGYPVQKSERKPRLPRSGVLMKESYQLDPQVIREYDSTFSEYLKNRKENPRGETWTQTVAEKLQHEVRPHMRTFLNSRDFLKK